MDLSPFGIQKKITSQESLRFSIHDIQRVRIVQGKRMTFHFNDDSYETIYRYDTEEVPSKGTYGEVYIASSKKTEEKCAIKTMKVNPKDREQINNILQEAVANIILYEETKDLVDGPYVQRFYEIGFDKSLNFMCLRMQYLPVTVGRYIETLDPVQADMVIPTLLIQLSKVIQYLEEKYSLNHRDLKTDNVMFQFSLIEGHDGHSIRRTPKVLLIDFGFICMKWRGIHFNATSAIPKNYKCMRPGRDLTFFIVELLASYGYLISEKLRKILKDLVTVKINGHVCEIDTLRCPEIGVWRWQDVSRKLLDSPNIDFENPKAFPENIIQIMSHYKRSLTGELFMRRSRCTRRSTQHRSTQRRSTQRRSTTKKEKITRDCEAGSGNHCA